MTAEEARYIEEHGEQIREYIQKQMHDTFEKSSKVPYDENTIYVAYYVPRRKHRKRRIQKKWLKRYGVKYVKLRVEKPEFKIEPPKFIEPDDSFFVPKALFGTPVVNLRLNFLNVDFVE